MVELELSDLIKRAQNHDEVSMEILFRNFKPKVTAIAREYFLIGADGDDLVQEGMIGLFKAINIYNAEKNRNFGAFASLCIHRALQNAVKNANRKKNSPLNSYLSINVNGEVDTPNFEESVKLIIVDDEADIERDFLDKEMHSVMIDRVKDLLTHEQFDILDMFLKGESYIRMSKTAELSLKQVDNAIQAIKKKLRAIKGDLE